MKLLIQTNLNRSSTFLVWTLWLMWSLSCYTKTRTVVCEYFQITQIRGTAGI